jgi:hypothetical protein
VLDTVVVQVNAQHRVSVYDPRRDADFAARIETRTSEPAAAPNNPALASSDRPAPLSVIMIRYPDPGTAKQVAGTWDPAARRHRPNRRPVHQPGSVSTVLCPDPAVSVIQRTCASGTSCRSCNGTTACGLSSPTDGWRGRYYAGAGVRIGGGPMIGAIVARRRCTGESNTQAL